MEQGKTTKHFENQPGVIPLYSLNQQRPSLALQNLNLPTANRPLKLAFLQSTTPTRRPPRPPEIEDNIPSAPLPLAPRNALRAADSLTQLDTGAHGLHLKTNFPPFHSHISTSSEFSPTNTPDKLVTPRLSPRLQDIESSPCAPRSNGEDFCLVRRPQSLLASHEEIPPRPTAVMDIATAGAPSQHISGFDYKLMKMMAEDMEGLRQKCGEEVRQRYAEQRQEIDALKIELSKSNAARADLTKRLDLAKASSKRILDASHKSLDELNASFKSLQNHSKESFASIANLRLQFSDLRTVRDSLVEQLEKIQSIIQAQNVDVEGSNTKALFQDLRQAYFGAQEVSALLREKLENSLGDLAEAKQRIHELEAKHLMESNTERRTAQAISDCTEQLSRLTSALAAQQKDSLDVLIKTSDLETQLQHANKQISELEIQLSDRDTKLATVTDVRQSNAELRIKMEETRSLLAVTERGRGDLLARINEQEKSIRSLVALNAELDAKSFENEVRSVREELQTAHTDAAIEAAREIATLKEQISAIEARARDHAVVRQTCEVLTCEVAVLREQKKIWEAGAAAEAEAKGLCRELRHEIAELLSQQKSEETKMKDITAELRDKEIAFAEQRKDLDACVCENASIQDDCRKLRVEVAALEEQKRMLLERICDNEDLKTRLNGVIALQEQNLASILKAIQEVLAREFHALKSTTHETAPSDPQETILPQMRQMFQTLQDVLVCELQALNSMSHEAELSGPQETVLTQMHHIEQLSRENEDLATKAANINSRYQSGNLTEPEKVFVQSIMQATKEVFEVDMVKAKNELRRKENLIKLQEGRIASLETSLAMQVHRKAEANAEAASGDITDSILDIPRLMACSSPPQGDATTRNANDTNRNLFEESSATDSSFPTPVIPSSYQDLPHVQEHERMNITGHGQNNIKTYAETEGGLGKRERVSSPDDSESVEKLPRRSRSMKQKEVATLQHIQQAPVQVAKIKARKRR